MKRIGVLGGASWLSSLEFYRRLNVLAEKNGSQFACANIMLLNLDFKKILEWQKKDNWNLIQLEIEKGLGDLSNGGCEIAAICSNTLHKQFDLLSLPPGLKMVSIIESVAAFLESKGLHSPCVFGTGITMKDPFYSAALKKRGLSPIPVDSDSLQLINKSIYQELVLGHCSAATQEMYKMACKRAAEHGADSVLLACTEIPLFIETSPWELPAVDTLECHVLEAAKKAGLFQ